jgi:uncharacterized BrkB/YihY/UPF0761 family membrane protein
MTWLWISAIVILLGAELNAEMEHQTVRDATTGAPKTEKNQDDASPGATADEQAAAKRDR